MQAKINSIWKVAQGLSRIEKIILMEKLIHQLKEESEMQEISRPIEEIYDMGKGIWNCDPTVCEPTKRGKTLNLRVELAGINSLFLDTAPIIYYL
ncbi:MAG TPA: hypothetical protein VK186_17765 [Candidatus Deferrimicrobium sp.]|nr:hypothetical protein [Candidatus Deferrimicrobium sp.]